MLIQVVPKAGEDAYKLLRNKVTHEAKTWAWGNKAKTRLKHKQSRDGHIDVGRANGVLVAQISSPDPKYVFFFAEKFIGRLVAWFEGSLATINLQFLEDAPKKKGRGRRRRKKK